MNAFGLMFRYGALAMTVFFSFQTHTHTHFCSPTCLLCFFFFFHLLRLQFISRTAVRNRIAWSSFSTQMLLCLCPANVPLTISTVRMPLFYHCHPATSLHSNSQPTSQPSHFIFSHSYYVRSVRLCSNVNGSSSVRHGTIGNVDRRRTGCPYEQKKTVEWKSKEPAK